MLPIKRRIRKGSFEEIMKEGVFVHSPDFYLRFLDKRDSFPSLFSFVVPVKVRKTSVGRHLVKRKMTAVVEGALSDISPGFLCVLFVKKDAPFLSYVNIKKEILELLVKAGILKEKKF